MKNRLLLPVFLCLLFVVGVMLALQTKDAEAGTPSKLVSIILRDKNSITTPAILSFDPTARTYNPKTKTPVYIFVNNEHKAMASTALMINSTTYIPLYDFCTAIDQASITQGNGRVSVTLPDLHIEASANAYYIKANGRYLYAPTLCKMIGDVMYVPIQAIAKAFSAIVVRDQSHGKLTVYPSTTPLEHGNSFYNETDLYWMSRIISAEARGECTTGKIAVGNVVMNRLRSPAYPDSVHGVIFDRRFGIQFSPAYSGSIDRAPDQECVIAAKLVLEGINVVGDSLFFNAVRVRGWASRNRTFVATIGNHNFYV